MKNLFKSSLELIKYNSIFIQPILLLFIVISFMDGVLLKYRGLTLPFTIMLITLLLLSMAVQSGWFYINAIAVKNSGKKYESPEERYMDVSRTFGKFFSGVGETFLKTIIGNILIGFVCFGIAYLVYIWGLHHIGSPKIFLQVLSDINANSSGSLTSIMSSSSSVVQKYSNLQYAKLFLFWGGAFFGLSNLFSFIFVLYNGIMHLENENPFKALVDMIVFTFRKFFYLILLFIITLVLSFLVNMISAIGSVNMIISALVLLFMFFYVNFYVFLILLFYEQNRTKDNSDIGSELNRQI